MVERQDAPAGTGMLLGRAGPPAGVLGPVPGHGRRPGEVRRSLLGRTEPVDRLEELFRLAEHGQATAEQLRLALCRARFDVALDGGGRPLIGPSPDGRPCLAVATSVAHRERVTAAGWRRVDLPDLVCLLPDGVDVLVNPTGPAPFRLPGNTVREALSAGWEES